MDIFNRKKINNIEKICKDVIQDQRTRKVRTGYSKDSFADGRSNGMESLALLILKNINKK